jgi:hypothetical protein
LTSFKNDISVSWNFASSLNHFERSFSDGAVSLSPYHQEPRTYLLEPREADRNGLTWHNMP